MKITPQELADLVEDIIEVNKRLSKEYVDEIKNKESEIQGLKAVCQTLKQFRDRALANGYQHSEEL